MRRGLAAGLGLALAFLQTGCGGDAPERADLVLITIDALSADRLGCFGGSTEAGRSLCALAEDGTLFAWAASPARGEAEGAATALTGLAAENHSLRDDGQSFLAEQFVTVADALSATGYRTAAFVTSPRLNRSRRLNQGFEYYGDLIHPPSNPETDRGIALAGRVQTWADANPAPRFIWIHVDEQFELAALDRMVSRLTQYLDPEQDGPGILFASLRGEVGPTNTLDLRAVRIPLFWRPPEAASLDLPRVSPRLASLSDLAPTLRSAAGLSPTAPEPAGSSAQLPYTSEPLKNHAATADRSSAGRDLSRLTRADRPAEPAGTPGTDAENRGPSGPEAPAERFVFLQAPGAQGEVGIASDADLYVRGRAPGDEVGRPVPTAALVDAGARFLSLPQAGGLRHPAPRSAALSPGPWRRDVLAADSPVPRLEFHLARHLGKVSRSPATSAQRTPTARGREDSASPPSPAPRTDQEVPR